MAYRHGCVYTRYADDLTFSTDDSIFPKALAQPRGDGSIAIGDQLINIVTNNWFAINNSKVKLHGINTRQKVTGLTVNKKVNVKRRYLKQIRAMLHAWERFGLDQAQDEYYKRHYFKKHRNPNKDQPIPLLLLVFILIVLLKEAHCCILKEASTSNPGYKKSS
ncbi:hypothetical protein ACFLTB_02740 [Chloroflexota bacterium]